MKRLFISIIVVLFCFQLFAQYNQGIKVETLLKTDTTTIGQKINYPVFEDAEVTICRITFPPGVSTGWHYHTIPVFAYVEKGTLTVEVKDKETMTFSEGQTFSEVINVLHNGTNSGDVDVILLAVYLGEKGKPLSEH